MTVSPTDLLSLSRLLDEALDVDAAAREALLVGMPAEQQYLVSKLRQLLEESDSRKTSGFLSALPVIDEASHPDESVAQPGELIGPYRAIREIGRGGMGAVWLAERADGTYKRQVALKLPRLAWGAGLAKRMTRERDIGAMLEHPNIARLYDAGVDERGRPFIALEYIDGIAIDAWCLQRKLALRDKLRLIVQVANAVAYAHGRLVVHRDLKPSNVLVSADGQVHLLDFGIAKLLDDAPQEHQATQEQARVLTLHYASPEQLNGETQTVQSDVYSMGVLAYELLTGQLPHDTRRKTSAAIEVAILQGEVIAPSQRVKDRVLARQLTGDIDAIVGKAMKVEQGQRYGTADALAADIERYLAGDIVTARPDSRSYWLRKMVKRHWVGVSATAAVLVSVLTGAAIAVMQAQRAVKAAERERLVKEFVADVFRFNVKEPAPGELRSASAEAILEHSAKLIRARFDGQPTMQAELYAVVGKAFGDMGAYHLTREYAVARLAALDAASAEPLKRAEALLDLASAHLESHQHIDAERRARQVVELAQGHPAITLAAKLIIARVLVHRGNIDSASEALDRMETQISNEPAAAGISAAIAMRARADLLNLNNRRPEAINMYDAAIAKAIALEGQESVTAAGIRLAAAFVAAQSPDPQKATVYFDAAIHVFRRLGHNHRLRASIDSAKFAVGRYMWAGQIAFEEAHAIVRHARAEIAATSSVVPSEVAHELDFEEGALLSYWGNVEAAEPLLARSAEASYRRATHWKPRLHLALRYGVHLMHRGRHDQADHWLREAMRARTEVGQGAHPYAANDYLFIAGNLRMLGRLKEAASFLGEAPRLPAMTGEGEMNPERYNLFLDELASEIALDQGDAARAMKLFPMGLLDSPGQETSHLTWDDDSQSRFVLGKILCALGSVGKGANELRTSLRRIEARPDYTHRPEMAYWRAVAGLCVLEAGDRTSAQRWAHQARESFTVQPGVSDFYKAPLLKLEAKLAKR